MLDRDGPHPRLDHSERRGPRTAASPGQLSPFGYLASLRPPIELAIFALDDPLPALLEVPASIYLAWARRKIAATRSVRAA